jgi:hypothetical protein
MEENISQSQSEIPQTFPASVSNSSWKSKLPLISGGLLLLVIVGAAGFLLGKSFSQPKTSPPPISQVSPSPSPTPENPISTPTPDPTANWKTYVNTAYNYSLKYPPDWAVLVKGDEATFPAPYFASPCNYDLGQLCSQVGIQVSDYDSTKKFDPNFIITEADKVSNKIRTRIGEEDAMEFVYFQSDFQSGYEINKKGRLLYVVVTNHHSKKYTFTYEESQKNRVIRTENDWQNKNLFDLILSTFKFLD